MISRFDPVTHAFLGLVQAANGGDLSIDGLWALVVGNDGNGGSSQRIYFSAGPDEETHGLFGVLAPSVPEPASWAMMVAGLGLAGAGLRRRRARVRFA
ncbi:MAG: PEPxxWA-CTERM sorting domain-containing protein [Sphingobium sp.]|nr:PEPxxWA-CTERM sorting domain-containing protein [Sphingobium sp.]